MREVEQKYVIEVQGETTGSSTTSFQKRIKKIQK